MSNASLVERGIGPVVKVTCLGTGLYVRWSWLSSIEELNGKMIKVDEGFASRQTRKISSGYGAAPHDE